MKLIDSILLSASVGFFIIGLNQVFAGAGLESYWIFMLSLICLFGYRMRKLQNKSKATVAETSTQTKTTTPIPKQKKGFSNSNYTKKKKRRK